MSDEVLDAIDMMIQDAAEGDERIECIIEVEHEHQEAARALNHEASQLALSLFPEDESPPYEPWPEEAFEAMWSETVRVNHKRGHVWDLDSETLPLFDDWVRNIWKLHGNDGPPGQQEFRW